MNIFASPYDDVAPGARIRRAAKGRVRYWSARIKLWLKVKPRSRTASRETDPDVRTIVNQSVLALIRSVEPAEGTAETFVQLWPEARLRTAWKTPRAISLTSGQPPEGAPYRSYEGVERLARHIAVREAAAALRGTL